jgi:hypothetical protein
MRAMATGVPHQVARVDTLHGARRKLTPTAPGSIPPVNPDLIEAVPVPAVVGPICRPPLILDHIVNQ